MLPKSGTSRDILNIVLSGVGLTTLACVVYVAAPFVEIRGWRPLENYMVRDIAVVLLLAAAGSFSGWSFWRKRRNASALADALADSNESEDDSPVLAERMADALTTLKTSSGGKATYLYDLPWYVIIGPPGSGKTTALVNSGLKFPLSGGATPAAVAGVGGTRYCDWWFSEDAIFIDTAGRYTTQDSDATTDKRGWLAFLNLLKEKRPRQPINGVIVAISLQDILMLDPAEVAAHAKAVRNRLLELHDRLKVDFPVYALFTKADLVAGFTEYFGNLDSEARRAVFGATFQTADKKRNCVAEIPKEFDALVERLNQTMLDRLQEEPAPQNRVSLYGFPAQLATLKRPLHNFLNAVFEPTRYHSNANLRGFYFSSGTQQGTPIDQLINALVKNFGARELGGFAHSGMGKSFFLYDLIEKLIIGEAAWVSTDADAVRRALILKGVGIGAIILVAAAGGGLWWKSYDRNMQLAGAVDSFSREYKADQDYRMLALQETVDDDNYGKTLNLLGKLRASPTGYDNRKVVAPLLEGLGMGQRELLTFASTDGYRLGLERILRSRLLYRLEEALQQHRDDPGYVYEALKVYKMLGGVAPQPIDRELILSWERQDVSENFFRGAFAADAAKQFEEHLVAMLDLDEGVLLAKPNGNLIKESEQTLARLKLADRAYQLLKSQARTLKLRDWTPAVGGGLDADKLFEAQGAKDLDSIRVPGFFTYDGFKRAFIEPAPGVADRVRKERWVLGEVGSDEALRDQYTTLRESLLVLYGRDFVAAWTDALSKLQIKRLTVDRPKYQALGVAASPTSPIKALFESIDAETGLTRERPSGNAATAKDAIPNDAKTRDAVVAAATFFGDRALPPGAEIEAQFRRFHDWLDAGGSTKQIDELLRQLGEVKDSLRNLPDLAQEQGLAGATLAPKVRQLMSTVERLPDPFQKTLGGAVKAVYVDMNNAELARLQRAFSERVAGACQQAALGRYPLQDGSTSEIGVADFGRLFGQGGIFESFFKEYLARYVDTSRPTWTYRGGEGVTAGLSQKSLLAFQQAARIRDAFFASGGTTPSVAITVFPPLLSAVNAPGATVKLEVNGIEVVTQAGVSVSPKTIQWPGAGGGRAAVIYSVEAPPAPAPSGGLLNGLQAPPAPAAAPVPLAPSMLERPGAWALLKLLRGASYHGDRLVVSFAVGGHNLTYGFQAGSSLKPLTLLQDMHFQCPGQL